MNKKTISKKKPKMNKKTTSQRRSKMENTELIREVVNTNRTLFDQAFNAGVAIQNETEKAVNTFLNNAGWVNKDAKNYISNLSDVYKQERDKLKGLVDEGFNNAERLLEGQSSSH